MKYIYAIVGSKAQTLCSQPLELENHIQMKSEKPSGDFIASEDGEWIEVVQDKTKDTERSWRNDELKLVASQESIWKYAYKVEIESYMQELADYTDKEGFPECERPLRPLTANGNDIII